MRNHRWFFNTIRNTLIYNTLYHNRPISATIIHHTVSINATRTANSTLRYLSYTWYTSVLNPQSIVILTYPNSLSPQLVAQLFDYPIPPALVVPHYLHTVIQIRDRRAETAGIYPIALVVGKRVLYHKIGSQSAGLEHLFYVADRCILVVLHNLEANRKFVIGGS